MTKIITAKKFKMDNILFSVNGYQWEADTHFSVLSTVLLVLQIAIMKYINVGIPVCL